MSVLLWITTEMEYKIKCYNRSLLLPRVVIKLTIKGLRVETHSNAGQHLISYQPQISDTIPQDQWLRVHPEQNHVDNHADAFSAGIGSSIYF